MGLASIQSLTGHGRPFTRCPGVRLALKLMIHLDGYHQWKKCSDNAHPASLN